MEECQALPHGDLAAAQEDPVAATRHAHGRAVQVDPIKPTLKPPGTKRLKLEYDEPLSSFAFNFKLRHYIMYAEYLAKVFQAAGKGLTLVHFPA